MAGRKIEPAGSGVEGAQVTLKMEQAPTTIFCDDHKKNLSAALTEYLSPRIELLGIGTIGRACGFCH